MLSAFTSCELGFGLIIDKGTFDKINEKRKGEKYSDGQQLKLKVVQKNDLLSSPFVREHEYKKNDGYWTHNNMVV